MRIPANETLADDPNQPKKESIVWKLDPRAIFPWRHTPHPLPRLIPHTEEFIAQGGYIGPHLPPMNMAMRGMTWINAAGFLGAKILSYGGWKSELEDAFQHAFAVGVQGMLHDVYKIKTVNVNVNDNDNDASEVKPEIDSETDSETETDPGKETPDEIADNNEESSSSESSSSSSESFPIYFQHSINPEDDYHLKQASPEDASHNMLEPSLVSLYRSAHTFGKHKLQIKLHSRPKTANLQSLFVLPFLTRKEVEDNVALKHSYKNIVKALQHSSIEMGRDLSYFEIGNLVAEKLDDMSTAQMERMKNAPIMQMTIVAQVSIQCDEVFVVRDTETGDIVQGDANGNLNDVTHLVRFEIVVDMNAETGEVEIGNWQITDWDDLLDGNMFFSDYHVLYR